jgi:hypothetical protein
MPELGGLNVPLGRPNAWLVCEASITDAPAMAVILSGCDTWTFSSWLLVGINCRV